MSAGLTEFLLARIAEDERDATAIRDCESFHGVESDVEEEVIRLSAPARVLAECAAKRAAVAKFAPEVDEGNGFGAAAQWALAFIGLPYADHPDYRDEWRP